MKGIGSLVEEESPKDAGTIAASASSSAAAALEHSIDFMETSNACFNPVHYHSFKGVSLLLTSQRCALCSESLQSVIFGFGRGRGAGSDQVVQCASCGEFAHRSCGLRRDKIWRKLCPVNSKFAEANKDFDDPQMIDTDEDDIQLEGEDSVNSENLVAEVIEVRSDSVESNARFPFLSLARLVNPNSECATTTSSETGGECVSNPVDGTIDASCEETSPSSQTIEQDYYYRENMPTLDPSYNTPRFQWTSDGPPRHWATDAQSDVDPIFLSSSPGKSHPLEQSEDLATTNSNEHLHFSSHPFSSVSRALQENVIAHFLKILPKDDHGLGETTKSIICSDSVREKLNDTNDNSRQIESARTIPLEKPPPSVPKSPSDAEVEGLLREVDPKFADDNSSAHRRLGLATVAGGIAGGVAGFAFMGPVGGVIGAKCGQTAGILGVLLEGSVSIGVLASGIAAGRYTGQQLQDKWEEKRVLAFGEDGTHRRVLLVRPNIKTDPMWVEIYAKARQSHRDSRSAGMTFRFLREDEAVVAKRERYEREADIVRTGEEEIPTADKVLLLVSRILNDRTSLPGHVFRQLLSAFRARSHERTPLDTVVITSHMMEAAEPYRDKETANAALNTRRRDAHAVIKYVTATLQEIRPGFASCAAMTELTATAVESLVFGEVYDLVINEIETVYADRDDSLLEKIADFERRQSTTEDYKSCVSEEALEALHRLPGAHSAVDKLRYCVQFLELISDFFSNSREKKSVLGADSLLKMVCQHVIMAKVFAINAQIAFLEEFARDEHLLRGREGYALVTLQSAVHFLTISNNFEEDIFGSED